MLRSRKGFTLIELLIVVVIIGILAAIAIPKFAQTKEKAYTAAMKSDLRNLATYEESYAADNGGSYMPAGTATGPVGATAGTAYNGFMPSSNVSVDIPAPSVAPNSWTATATHSLMPAGKTCSMGAAGVITCL